MNEYENMIASVADINADDISLHPVLKIFDKWSVQRLCEILLVDEVDIRDLSDFLAQRWYIMLPCSQLHYYIAPEYKINRACIAAARYIKQKTGQNIYQILMPTLTVTKSITSTDLSKEELGFSEFILSDDKKRVIEISGCLLFAQQDFQLKHTAWSDGPLSLLSSNETAMLMEHSPAVRDCWKKISDKCLIEKEDQSFGGVIRRLIKELRLGGVKSRNSRVKGTEVDSGMAANIAIFCFSEWLKTLDDEEKKDLLMQKSTLGNLHFEPLVGRLLRPNDAIYAEATYCVELIAHDLETIYKDNQAWFDHKFPRNIQSEEKAGAWDAHSTGFVEADMKIEAAIKNLEQLMADTNNIFYKNKKNHVYFRESLNLFSVLIEQGVDAFEYLDESEIDKFVDMFRAEVGDEVLLKFSSQYLPLKEKLTDRLKKEEQSARFIGEFGLFLAPVQASPSSKGQGPVNPQP